MASLEWSSLDFVRLILMKNNTKKSIKQTEDVFSALSHSSRRHILLTLHFRGGTMTAGEIANRFGCSWPTTTRHLKVLTEAGLISVRKMGRERIYHLECSYLLEVTEEWLNWFKE